MKKYFEYELNSNTRDNLVNYYEDINLAQHNHDQSLKSNLKLKRIRKLMSFSKKDKVLDVGCSYGYLIKSLSREIDEGKGIDISNKIIDKAIRDNIQKNISFETFDGNMIVFNNKFSKVLLVDVLEHAIYPDILIRIVKENLLPNGLLLIEVPFTGFISEFVAGEYHQGHMRYYDPEYLSNYIKKFGFDILNLNVYNSVPFAAFFLKYNHLFFFLDYLINLIPSKIYPYFGEILILAGNISNDLKD